MTFSRLGLVEVVTQDRVNKIGLRDFELVRGSLGELLIIVCNDDGFIFVWERPGAHITVQFATSAGVALHVVTLLAKRLPILEVVRAVSRPRNPVVRAELYVRFLPSARGASVAVFLFDCPPVILAWLRSRLSLRPDFQALQLRHWLEKFDRHGLSWKMLPACSIQTKVPRLKQLSTNSKRSGMWGYGSRVTLSARAFLTTVKEYSLSDLIDRRFPISSILTAANCLGIIRRERRAGRKLDPAFMKSLSQTLRFWFSVAEALGTPKRRAIAPRYAPKLASIKAATLTDQYYVARNLTWNECEKLMGFPEGWTVGEGDSLATP